jgi:hypothetical protein
MCLCFYLFFAGLILLYTVLHDLWKIGKKSKTRPEVDCRSRAQRSRTQGDAGNFSVYCFGDSDRHMHEGPKLLPDVGRREYCGLVGQRYVFGYFWARQSDVARSAIECRRITAAFLSLFRPVLFFCMAPSVWVPETVNSCTLVEDVGGRSVARCSYLLIDAFSGFSILLGLGVLLAIYGLFDPGFGRWRASELGNNQNVS